MLWYLPISLLLLSMTSCCLVVFINFEPSGWSEAASLTSSEARPSPPVFLRSLPSLDPPITKYGTWTYNYLKNFLSTLTSFHLLFICIFIELVVCSIMKKAWMQWVGCFVLHLNLQINFIIKPSVPLGKVTTMCDFHQIPIIFRPPLPRYTRWSARNGMV